eukprot:jgi/Botrbrau1/7720/Bobra.0159s0152.1
MACFVTLAFLSLRGFGADRIAFGDHRRSQNEKCILDKLNSAVFMKVASQISFMTFDEGMRLSRLGRRPFVHA